jgi:beta-lactamase superfamily II metal-dependent hydrolase
LIRDAAGDYDPARLEGQTREGLMRGMLRLPVVAGLALLLLGPSTLLGPGLAEADCDDQFMQFHFIDVGQGDSILLKFPCGTMLIDAGGDAIRGPVVVSYVKGLLAPKAREPNNTITGLNLVVLSHPHTDHTRYLNLIAARRDGTLRIDRYLGNGQSHGSGHHAQTWIHAHVPAAKRRSVTLDNAVEAQATLPVSQRAGLTDSLIDPFDCPQQGVNPDVRIMWSTAGNRRDGWAKKNFEEENNHSVVVKVRYGQLALLFKGDLEEPAIEDMGENYAASGALKSNGLKVGRHGSYNGTTSSQVAACGAEYEAISYGHWNEGRRPNNKYSTWTYGHPRQATIDLQLAGSLKSGDPINVWIASAWNSPEDTADGRNSFRRVELRKAAYSTPRDDNVAGEATKFGNVTVTQRPAAPN